LTPRRLLAGVLVVVPKARVRKVVAVTALAIRKHAAKRRKIARIHEDVSEVGTESNSTPVPAANGSAKDDGDSLCAIGRIRTFIVHLLLLPPVRAEFIRLGSHGRDVCLSHP